jgi:hypothetical protein
MGKANPNLTHEVVLNLGGNAVMTARVDEATAGQVAQAFGMNWPAPYLTKWPLLIRAIGQAGAVEAQALADALKPVAEIPEGEFVVWFAGNAGALDAPAPAAESGEPFEVLDFEAAVGRLRELCKDRKGWGWIVQGAGPGEVLAR